MAAMNVVHMRVKPGMEQAYLEMNRTGMSSAPGLTSLKVIKTGERSFCVVGLWDSMQSLIDARASMIANLDSFRHMLEDLGGGRGVTEPWSGEVVVDLNPAAANAI